MRNYGVANESERVATPRRPLIGKLRRSNGFLRMKIGSIRKAKNWGVMSAKNKFSRPVDTVDDALVAAMCENGWLKLQQDGTVGICSGTEVLIESQSTGNCLPNLIQGQHRIDVIARESHVIDKSIVAKRNEAENPLTWLHRRKDKLGDPFISKQQFDASEILRRDYTFAQLEPSITFRWSDAGTVGSRSQARCISSGLEGAEKSLASRKKFQSALDAIGPDLSSIAMEICCLSRGLEAAERRLGFPRRSGKILLRIALEKLAVHYHLVTPSNVQFDGPKMSHWAKPCSRPEI